MSYEKKIVLDVFLMHSFAFFGRVDHKVFNFLGICEVAFVSSQLEVKK